MGHRTTRLFTDLTRRFCVKRKLRIENEESKYRSSNSWMAETSGDLCRFRIFARQSVCNLRQLAAICTAIPHHCQKS
jgi:hypothetical protein